MSNFALVVEVAGAHRNFTAFLTLIYEKKRCFFRIALFCTQEDSAAILSIGNDAAAELQIPPEAILNNSNGMKSANIRFSVPFAEPEYRQNLLEQLNLCTKKENLELQNTVFQGDILPKVPNSAEFRTACDKLGLSLLLGKKHHFLGENFCTNISRGNLLIAGYDWNLRRGLLHSIFYSLKSLPQKPAILYLNSDEEMILSLHELLHFIYPKHNTQFYEALTVCMPDWKERKRLLDYEIVLGV